MDSRDRRRSARSLGVHRFPLALICGGSQVRRFGGSPPASQTPWSSGADKEGVRAPSSGQKGHCRKPTTGWVLGELPGVGVEENDLTWAPGVEIAWPGTS